MYYGSRRLFLPHRHWIFSSTYFSNCFMIDNLSVFSLRACSVTLEEQRVFTSDFRSSPYASLAQLHSYFFAISARSTVMSKSRLMVKADGEVAVQNRNLEEIKTHVLMLTTIIIRDLCWASTYCFMEYLLSYSNIIMFSMNVSAFINAEILIKYSRMEVHLVIVWWEFNFLNKHKNYLPVMFSGNWELLSLVLKSLQKGHLHSEQVNIKW